MAELAAGARLELDRAAFVRIADVLVANDLGHLLPPAAGVADPSPANPPLEGRLVMSISDLQAELRRWGEDVAGERTTLRRRWPTFTTRPYIDSKFLRHDTPAPACSLGRRRRSPQSRWWKERRERCAGPAGSHSLDILGNRAESI